MTFYAILLLHSLTQKEICKMKLINGFDLMTYAKAHHLVLPAFNTTNMELTLSIVKGLNNAHLPGYVQISSSNLKISSPKMIADITREAMALYKVETPIGLHLDHGTSFEDVKACVDAGFTSIMMDASRLPYQENMKEVRRAVEYCHFYGIPVEAELGCISGKEDDIVVNDAGKTDPDMVAEFLEKTQCDTLAVSIGNVHGLSLMPDIDLPLLKKISEIAGDTPLVLHGGSGIPAEIIRQAEKYNLIKINYGSDIRRVFIHAFGEAYMEDQNAYNIMSCCKTALTDVTQRVQELVTMINAQ